MAALLELCRIVHGELALEEVSARVAFVAQAVRDGVLSS